MFIPSSRGGRLRAAVRAAIGVARIIMSKKPNSREQEEMLAKIAMSERMLMKHWRWLEAAGLLKKRNNWLLSPRAKFYIKMITHVHGPHMPKDQVQNWYNLLRSTGNSELIETFWSFHIDRRPQWLRYYTS